MRRLVSLVLVAAVGLSIGFLEVANAAPAKPKKYASCAALNRDFPYGVAATPAAAAAIEAARHYRPATNKKVYNANVRLDSPKNGTVCEVALPAVAPSAVEGLRVIGQTMDRVDLAWSAPTNNGGTPVTGYKIVGSAGSATVVGTNATVNGLTPGTSYTFGVVAVNAAGESPPTTVTAKTNSPAPTPTPVAPAMSGATRYANCTAARAAGVAPIRRDSNPDLYAANRHLDRDGDGIACD